MIHTPRSLGLYDRRDTHPPNSDPLLKAARKVEIRNAHTMRDDPKWGARSREPTSWNPMLKKPRAKIPSRIRILLPAPMSLTRQSLSATNQICRTMSRACRQHSAIHHYMPAYLSLFNLELFQYLFSIRTTERVYALF